MADPNNVKSIFSAASEIPAAERDAFLDEAVAGDAALRARIEALLKVHDNPDSFLEDPAAEFGATIDLSPTGPPLAEKPGTLIGPYKLLEQIGEGGMGVVYMADQQAPVRRRVALKIIKAGMDTRQVIARFEAERQALALMDHSNIARVLDAGATETGRPYFVMELVRGVPITEYCDQNNLPVHGRLELFVQVCHALQHAHQKGIIHRDLKPSNVLVTVNDGRAVPKVIDFGVAKATGQQLTEKTLFTAFAQMVGTPLYMSPEQAEMTSLDIDTRSDIYSLGVLLYELLTGTTPFDQERMRSAAFDEIRRIIREEEPPKPSTRLSTLGEVRTATAAHRQVDSHRLSQLVEGDLDWIVMKALEKDRTRRYDTAGNFADDVVRHLSDEPVEACPPKRLYRLKKFVRRNKAGVLAGSSIVAALAIGLAAASYFAATASREAKSALHALEQAESNRKTADGVNRFFAEEVFSLANPGQYNRYGISLMEALDIAAVKVDQRFPGDPELRAVLYDHLGDIYFGSDQPKKAIAQFRKAVADWGRFAGELDQRTLHSRSHLGGALSKSGQNDEARKILETTLAAQTKSLGAAHLDTLYTARKLGFLLMGVRDSKDLEFTEDVYQRSLAALGPRHPATLEAEYGFSWVLRWRGQSEKALGHAQLAATGLREVSGSENVYSMLAAYNYAACLQDFGRLDEAATELKSLHDTRIRVLGLSHTTTLQTTWRLSAVLHRLGRTTDAKALLDDVASHVEDGRATDFTLLADAYAELGEHEAALKWTKKTVELQPPKDANQYSVLALMRLSAADVDGYREACAAMSKRFSTTPDVNAKFLLAWSFCLGPSALDELSRPIKLAGELVKNSPQDANYLAAVGILLYRAEKYDEALEKLSASIAAHPKDEPEDSRKIYARYFLAMTEWKLNHKVEARRLLPEAQKSMDEAMESPPAWDHRAALDLFRREAEALIQPVESTAPSKATDSTARP